MSDPDKVLERKLDTAIELLRHLLAIELSKGGVPKSEIGKHLRVAKSSVVKMLRSYKEGKANEDKPR